MDSFEVVPRILNTFQSFPDGCRNLASKCIWNDSFLILCETFGLSVSNDFMNRSYVLNLGPGKRWYFNFRLQDVWSSLNIFFCSWMKWFHWDIMWFFSGSESTACKIKQNHTDLERWVKLDKSAISMLNFSINDNTLELMFFLWKHTHTKKHVLIMYIHMQMHVLIDIYIYIYMCICIHIYCIGVHTSTCKHVLWCIFGNRITGQQTMMFYIETEGYFLTMI